MKTTINIDSKGFDAGFIKYLELSKRGIVEDVNQKAYSVCISATAITKRANKSKIRAALRSASRVNQNAPVAAIIVNYNRGRRGLKGFSGQVMKDKAEELIEQRANAINFLRAGWLSAVSVLARSIGKTPGKNAQSFLSRFGTGNGGGIAAKKSNNPTAYFWNQAFSRHTSTNNGVRFAEEGLQKALNQETSRMGEYVARKQKERASKAFSRFFR